VAPRKTGSPLLEEQILFIVVMNRASLHFSDEPVAACPLYITRPPFAQGLLYLYLGGLSIG